MLLSLGNVPTPAVVCYAADRNELRSRVIQWLQTEVVPDGWFVKGSNFSDILHKYFKVGLFPLKTQWTCFSNTTLCTEYPGLFICVGLL